MEANDQFSDYRFPKSARLLKRRDFLFDSYRKLHTPLLTYIWSCQGRGRLGISLSKKVLRNSNKRNRVRRIVREAFRQHRYELGSVDIHVLGKERLKDEWDKLKRQDIEQDLFQIVSGHRFSKKE